MEQTTAMDERLTNIETNLQRIGTQVQELSASIQRLLAGVQNLETQNREAAADGAQGAVAAAINGEVVSSFFLTLILPPAGLNHTSLTCSFLFRSHS